MADPISAALIAGLGAQAGSVAAFAISTGTTLAITAGTSLALQALTPSSTTRTQVNNEGSRLTGAKVTSAAEGKGIPELYSTFRVGGNIIWATRFKEEVVTETTTESVSSGGKGGGGRQTAETTTTTTTYNYSCSFAVAFCEGEVDSLSELYFDGNSIDLNTISYTFYRGTDTQTPDATIESVEGSGNVPAYRGTCYIVFNNLPLAKYGNRVPQVTCTIKKTASGTQTLDTVVKDLCLNAGLLESDIDVTDLSSQLVFGYLTEGLTSPRDAIEELSAAYFFHASDIGGVLTFRRRSTPAYANIPLSDVVISQENPTGFEVTTQQEEELPSEVIFTFTDMAKGYASGAVTSEKIGAKSSVVNSMGGLLVLTEGDARNRANVALRESYAAKDTFRFSVPLNKYKIINCGDYVVFTVETRKFVLKVISKEVSKDLLLECSLVDEQIVEEVIEQTIYTNQALPSGSTPLEISFEPTPTDLTFLNLPILPSEELTDYQPKIAVYQEPWFGGVNIYKEDGSGGHNLFTQANFPSVVGTLDSDLGKGITDVWDMKNSLTVTLDNSDNNLASLSDLSVLNGANTCAVLTPSGEWEVLQFANAELNENGSYTLTKLLRGQLGTEYYMGEPTPSGSKFVLLALGRLGVLPINESGIGVEQNLRYGPFGITIDDDSYTDETYTPKATAFRPYAPTHLKESYNSGNINLSWVRRCRFNGDGWTQEEVPLNEDTETYEVDILDGETVVRTLETFTPNVTYTSAQQTEDFGSTQSSLSWKVYQISATYGRGTPAIG